MHALAVETVLAMPTQCCVMPTNQSMQLQWAFVNVLSSMASVQLSIQCGQVCAAVHPMWLGASAGWVKTSNQFGATHCVVNWHHDFLQQTTEAPIVQARPPLTAWGFLGLFVQDGVLHHVHPLEPCH